MVHSGWKSEDGSTRKVQRDRAIQVGSKRKFRQRKDIEE
jgi:hypothetical protein